MREPTMTLIMVRYIERMPYEVIAWRVDATGSWTEERVGLGEEPISMPDHLQANGYVLVREEDRLAVYAHPDSQRGIRYVVLVWLGEEPEVINAPTLPGLLHALQRLATQLGEFPRRGTG